MKHENLVLSNESIKIESSPSKIWKADISSVRTSSEQITIIQSWYQSLIW